MAIKSEYNPRGLKLKAILDKIHRAYETDDTIPIPWPPDSFDLVRPRLDQLGAKVEDGDAKDWKDALTAMHDHPDPRLAQITPSTLHVRFRNLMDADQMCLLDGDDDLAKQIKEHPMLVLLSPRHADAMARWSYGQRHGVSRMTRNTAAELLDATRTTSMDGGAPSLFAGDLGVLKDAYEDLVEYGRGLRDCIRVSKTAAVVETHFRDACDGEPFLAASIDKLVNSPAKAIPTGKQFAQAVFEDRVGWSREQIRKKLSGI